MTTRDRTRELGCSEFTDRGATLESSVFDSSIDSLGERFDLVAEGRAFENLSLDPREGIAHRGMIASEAAADFGE